MANIDRIVLEEKIDSDKLEERWFNQAIIDACRRPGIKEADRAQARKNGLDEEAFRREICRELGEEIDKIRDVILIRLALALIDDPELPLSGAVAFYSPAPRLLQTIANDVFDRYLQAKGG